VYQRVFASYLPRIGLVLHDPLLTPDQRQAMLAALQLEQHQAAEAAMERELGEEKARAKTQAMYRLGSRSRTHRRRHP
jgi:hypothetical protein